MTDPLSLGIAALVVLVALIAIRIPIGYAMAAVGMGGVLILSGPAILLSQLKTLAYGTFSNYDLSVVPLFILMGHIATRAQLSQSLFRAANAWFGRLRGGVAMAAIAACAGFGAVCGSSLATASTMGKVALPELRRYRYSPALATGTLAAGGVLGILIPPSIMLVVMGPVLEVPVTDLFAAAILPGVMMAVLYLAYALGRCWLNPTLGPPLREDQIPGDRSHVWREFFMGLVPPTILIAFAMGSILFGWATPTEGAGMGAFGSVLLTIGYRKFTWKRTYDALLKTLEISVLILFLVAASNFFGAVFSRLGTPGLITDWLLVLDLSPSLIIIMILAMVFILGWPLEWVPIVLIILPILQPVLVEMNVNMTWFAILVAVCLQTAWLSPPVALSAYFLKGVAPDWDLKDIYYGMMQFMTVQIFGLVLVFLFPWLALWLPGYLYGN